MKKYDLIVIGGGPAGYAAAIHGRHLGKSVLLIEKTQLGGTCLNRGCIPTKSFLESAGLYRQIQAAEEKGIAVSQAQAVMEKIVGRKNRVVGTLVKGLTSLLAQKGVDILAGTAQFLDNGLIEVEKESGTETFQGDRYLIATGTQPRNLGSIVADGGLVQNSDQILDCDSLPRHLVIIGGGVIGCEFASVFRSLGSEVTILEIAPQILPTEDQEVAQLLTREFKKQKIAVFPESQVNEIIREEQSDQPLVVRFQNRGKVKELNADRVLLSVGRRPVLPPGLSCDLTEAGYIKIDDNFATSQPNVYAAGDVIGGLQLAHLAFHEGIAAVDAAFGQKRPVSDHVPRCVYSFPEVASVGMTEEQARRSLTGIQVGKFSLKGNGKALISGENNGLVKVVAAENGKVVGVQIIGPHATELIAQGVMALEQGLTLQEWAQAIQPHPTVSESIGEAVLAGLGFGLHS